MDNDFEKLRAQIAQRSARLAEVAAELKTELFGIDEVIDRVIDSVRAWYVLPEIINRPVIICLWGLTGTGKTQLTRSLAQKLGFYDKFVEVQMDGFTNDTGRAKGTISSMLGEALDEGQPGILVLDEFQRFRTIDHQGGDVKVERYMDVWTLLSDGRLAPSLSFMNELQMELAQAYYQEDVRIGKQPEDADTDDYHDGLELPDGQALKPGRQFFLRPYQASELKQTLKLSEPLLEVMAMSREQIVARMKKFVENPSSWETNYSKLLIFVCGNLDEMYSETADRVADCDTDADIFHEMTKKLSLIDVKNAMGRRFKPEQIARLGNNHVIYPSFSRKTYEKLIDVVSNRYICDIEEKSGLLFSISCELKAEIYNNAVFPAQGTRPLFSSIHSILSSSLVNFTVWALENGARPGDRLEVSVDNERRNLVVAMGASTHMDPISFELNSLKQGNDHNFRSLLAVHEAGHGLVYALLFEQVPQEIKINLASYSGGYSLFSKLAAESRRNILDGVCVALAGLAAEIIVFGKELATVGNESDLKFATKRAAQLIRYHGLGSTLSRIDKNSDSDDPVNTNIDDSNEAIEAILQEQMVRAKELLNGNRAVYLRVANCLVEHGEVPKELMAKWLGLALDNQPTVLEPYTLMLDEFSKTAYPKRGAHGKTPVSESLTAGE